jgi:aspartate racemase
LNNIQTNLKERIESLSPDKRALLEKLIREKLPESSLLRQIRRRPEQEVLPLSFAQQRMWFLDQLEPGSPSYNISRALLFAGPLNAEALERSLNEILRRHEAMRTVFPSVDGDAVQVITPHRSFSVPVTDLRNIDGGDRLGHAHRMAMEEFQRPFDLSTGPLFRAGLLRVEDEVHVLLLTMHHIVSDGWSMGVFFRELAALYEAFSGGRSSSLPDLPIQYADFAHWQRQWFKGKVLEQQLSYWKRQISGSPPVLELPTDRPRPPIQTYNGATCSVTLSRELTDALKALSRREEITLFMTLLAAFQTLLHRYTGQDDILVGTPIANRNRVELEGLIGFFVNMLVMRTDLSGDPRFRELLGRVRDVALGAYEHQDLPFEKLVEELHPERDMSRTPIFQVAFQLRNVPKSPLQFPGLKVDDFGGDNPISKFDLSVDVAEHGGELSCLFEYNTDLFDAATMERMAGHFHTLLEGVAVDPDRKISALPLLTEAENRQLQVEWNDTRVDLPMDRCVHRFFEDQVERTSNAVAVVFEEESLTYRELNARSNCLARCLQKRGVGPDVLVGICMERSLEMVVGILGVLKAGGAYVPLDPSYPKERLEFMLDDARPAVLLTQSRLAERLPARGAEMLLVDSGWDAIAREDGGNLPGGESPENLAYVIYTSGSTGRPKGVMVPHRAFSNNILWGRRHFHLTEADVVAQISTFCFDASVSEMFLALLSGAKLVMTSPSLQYDPVYLLKTIAEQKVTMVELVPALIKVLLEEKGIGACDCLKRCISGGESLSVELQDRFLETLPGVELYNSYGPTETTIDATCWTCRGGEDRGTVPIGRPIANFRAHILDGNLQPVPIGVPGELYLGGPGLARGYLNSPELTEEKFIADPFRAEAGSRLYRTGDRVRYRPDGNICFLGRIDNQVKVRGFRIELGEIEWALRRHPAVHDAVVMAVGEMETATQLAAYLVPASNSALPSTVEMRDFLKKSLPDYMVPAIFIALEALPLTPSGKVNRRALPLPDGARVDKEGSFVAPRDELEKKLASLWEKVLMVKPVGVRDNFFELGGHSLLAVRLFAQIGKEFGKSLPLSTLFQAPTVGELADILRPDGFSSQWSYLVPIQPNGSNPPIFCVHPHDGDALVFRNLAVMLGPEQPLYGLRARSLGSKQPFHDRIEHMAADYIAEIRALQPEGPYFLGGHCFGGVVAFEMARQIIEQGEKVALVALIFSYAPKHPKKLPGGNFLRNACYKYITRIDRILSLLPLVEPSYSGSDIYELLKFSKEVFKKKLLKSIYQLLPLKEQAYLREQEGGVNNLGILLNNYVPKVYPGRLTLFRTQKEAMIYVKSKTWGWGDLAAKGVEIHEFPGYNGNLNFKPRVRILAEEMKRCLAEIQGKNQYGNTSQ